VVTTGLLTLRIDMAVYTYITIIIAIASFIAILVCLAMFWNGKDSKYTWDRREAASVQKALPWITLVFLFSWAWPLIIPAFLSVSIYKAIKSEVEV
jgi:hypothetical protein